MARLALAALVAFACLATTVSAAITCALPAGGTYSAGQPMILDWGSDGTTPTVTELITINATLYCNSGAKIAAVQIPNLSGPYNWTVPSVGNATTVGGTTGICVSNTFYIEYQGLAYGFLNIQQLPWGPTRCGTVTILPAPNGTLTTTTTTMSATVTTTASPSPTASSSDSSGGLSTTVIVIIAVVAAVLATLAVVALVVCIRRQRRRRRNDALMPWNSGLVTTSNNNGNNNNTSRNRFSKVSSIDDTVGISGGGGAGSSGAPAMAGVGLGLGAAAAVMKSQQPTLPPDQYFPEDEGSSYAYQQQQQLLQQQQQQPSPDEDDSHNDDGSYYNPYYAGGNASMSQSNPSFYSALTPGSRYVQTPFGQDQYRNAAPADIYQQHLFQQKQQQQQQLGYFPPPPATSSSSAFARSPAAPGPGSSSNVTIIPTTAPGPTPLSSSVIISVPTTISSSASSSPRRAPQHNVMQEMGSKEAESNVAASQATQEAGSSKRGSSKRAVKVEVVGREAKTGTKREVNGRGEENVKGGRTERDETKQEEDEDIPLKTISTSSRASNSSTLPLSPK
ncbi:hypothetical protein EMPS_07707 [Entomortierella parvispora]|uniref:Uncharacterized protein n=1 Tax=Entomortierella parvispora TaxID=205924 RepID=A0A9P3HEP3_9FUNG|nr:hypothetical protein EMPS_07707 [Entomortierella parvispora]